MVTYSRIVAHSFGGPEVLQYERCEALPEPGEGEVRLRVEVAGVGYTDTILRRGFYRAYTGGLPVTPGYDVVGLVDKLGGGVSGLQVGDRVADMPVHGAYSQYLVRPADGLIPVPTGVRPEAAVEVPLMWVTAWQLLTRCVSLPAGATVLVVGASGAVGRPLVQLAVHLGYRVIGTCSNAKIPLVVSLGATAIDYRRDDLQDAILAETGGAGVTAAFDAIGGSSWETSWRVLGKGGSLLGYGFQEFLETDGAPSEAARILHQFNETWNEEGRKDGTERTTQFYDIQLRRGTHPDDYRQDATHLLNLMAAGTVVPPPPEILPLESAPAAHRRVGEGRLEQRLVLQP